MDAAAAGEERPGVELDDGASGVGVGEHLARLVVGRVVEGARDDGAVGDVVVDVAVVDPALGVAEHGGRGQPDDLERLAVGVGLVDEERGQLAADRGVGVCRVALLVQQHPAGAS